MEQMNIPYRKKADLTDDSCASVCFQMALAYFGIEKNIEEIYGLVEAHGKLQIASQWGLCLGAASEGLYAAYISKYPKEYDELGVGVFSESIGCSREKATAIVQRQVQTCGWAENRISLIEWKDDYRTVPADIVREQLGVVIVGLWNERGHAVVLTGWETDKVAYHDPDGGPNDTMSIEKFDRQWCHPDGANDLLIISKTKLDVKKAHARRAGVRRGFGALLLPHGGTIQYPNTVIKPPAKALRGI